MFFFGGGMQSPRRRNREKSILLTIFLVVTIYFIFFANSSEHKTASTYDDEDVLRGHHPGSSHQWRPVARNDMVVASMKKDNTSWLFENFPDWHKSIYVVDDESAELTVDRNKGRESMVYLT